MSVYLEKIVFLIPESNNPAIQSILNERCDGNRNIFHAVVNMCTPTSNKENDNGNYFSLKMSY